MRLFASGKTLIIRSFGTKNQLHGIKMSKFELIQILDNPIFHSHLEKKVKRNKNLCLLQYSNISKPNLKLIESENICTHIEIGMVYVWGCGYRIASQWVSYNVVNILRNDIQY